MKNLLPVCAGLVVISGIVSANLWQDLRAERELVAELRAQLAAPTQAGRAVEPVRIAEADPPPATSIPAPVEKPEAPSAKTAQAANAAVQFSSFQAALGSQAELMKDPEFRKAQLAQTRMFMRRMYGDVGEELGLSEKEVDQLFDILAAQQQASAIPMLIGANGQPTAQNAEEMMRVQQASQRKRDEDLQALLGGRYPQWQEYQQTLPARSRATSLSTTLASAGLPMSQAQLRPLTAALVAEQKRNRQDPMTAFRNVAQNGPPSMTLMLEEAQKRQEENNRALLAAAAPHLTPQQLAAVRENFEQQAAMSRASARLQRAQAEAQTGGQPSAAIIVNGF